MSAPPKPANCVYLRPSEAYALTATGEQRVPHYNCHYPDEHPERFADLPRWIQEEAISGRVFRWEKHCDGCPVRKPRPIA